MCSVEHTWQIFQFTCYDTPVYNVQGCSTVTSRLARMPRMRKNTSSLKLQLIMHIPYAHDVFWFWARAIDVYHRHHHNPKAPVYNSLLASNKVSFAASPFTTLLSHRAILPHENDDPADFKPSTSCQFLSLFPFYLITFNPKPQQHSFVHVYPCADSHSHVPVAKKWREQNEVGKLKLKMLTLAVKLSITHLADVTNKLPYHFLAAGLISAPLRPTTPKLTRGGHKIVICFDAVWAEGTNFAASPSTCRKWIPTP